MNNNTKFVFFGTDTFAVKVLDTLKNRGFIPSLIVTQPDKPVGRKQTITAPPTKIWGTINNVDISQPETLKNVPEELTTDRFDFFVVASYGKIIPQAILDLPKLGTLNIHPSILPKYRGASPLEYTILNGDSETGVTIMLMDAKMDHGPILNITKYEIPNPNTITYPELLKTLAELGANSLAGIIPEFVSGQIKPQEQNHDQATYTKLIKKTDGEINPFNDPKTAWRKYRAFIEWPGVYFFKDNKRIIVKQARLENDQFIIERIIPEGKNEMDWDAF